MRDTNLHEVRERDYFFVGSFSVWGLWAGIGIATLWREAAREMGATMVKMAPILGLAVVPLIANWSWASRAHDYSARDWAYNLLMSVEPYGVLFTNGDNDTFPLWYLQEAEGIRRDVTVIVTSYLNTDWYAKQLRDLTAPCPEGVSAEDDPTLNLCQRAYTGSNTDAIYVGPGEQAADGKVALHLEKAISRPSKSILPLDDATIDRVARSYSQLDRTQAVPLGNVTAVVQGGTLLYPWEQYALVLISHSIDERPIYFASSGNAATSLGLDGYLIRHGLAFKLNNGALEESDTVVRMAETPYVAITGPWVDMERTRVLADEVFVHRTGLPEGWSHWPDQATIGIPNYYAWAYLALAQAALQRADSTGLARYQERSEAWTELGT